MRALTLIVAALASLTSCVDIYRGALVQFNLRQATRSAAGEHYEMFAVVNGGAVPIGRFKILNTLSDCGGVAGLTANVDLVARYDNGASVEDMCQSDRRLGLVDKVDLATATLAGGIKLSTPVDLSEADSVFITVEPDGDTDERPGAAVMRGDLDWGVAPFRPTQIACRQAFCEGLDADDAQASALFDQLCGENIPALPRAVRGVRRAVLLRAPVTDECNAVEVGELAVVPAEDDTFL